MNLVLALIWLFLGVTVLAWQQLTDNAGLYFPVGEYHVSYAWVMFLLVVYNLRRWWYVRGLQRSRRPVKMGAAIRPARVDSAPPVPPNPELNFADPPTPPSTPV